MNVREEDRQKNNCPGRGLGLAAAAIGVGVGAALYYFFNKRPENPDGEGSTTEWTTERPQSFDETDYNDASNSYITVSEHSTTDTSIHSEDDSSDDDSESNNSAHSSSTHSSSNSDNDNSDHDEPMNDSIEDSSAADSDVSFNSYTDDNNDDESNISDYTSQQDDDIAIASYLALASDAGSDPDATEWDITSSSLDIPESEQSASNNFWFMLLTNLVSSPQRRRTRQRTWSLEECSICFDVILKNQKVTTLPCTHHFHTQCIEPWLQEQQTCPNCRKSSE